MATVYRRICVLRVHGRAGEAETLARADLAQVLQQAGNASATPELFTAQRDALFRAEEERVAQAQLLAELLAPLLIQRPADPAAVPASNAVPPVPRHLPRGPLPDTEPDAIASLLDGMLDQERNAPRSRR